MSSFGVPMLDVGGSGGTAGLTSKKDTEGVLEVEAAEVVVRVVEIVTCLDPMGRRDVISESDTLLSSEVCGALGLNTRLLA